VRVGEAIELVDDEQAKDDKRSGIGPELISEQTGDEEHFDDAVAEERAASASSSTRTCWWRRAAS
jgi:hypothetical protein